MGRLDKWITLATDSKAQPELRIPISMRVFEDYSLEPRDLRIEGVVGGKPQAFTVDVLRRRAGASGAVHLEVRKILGRFNRPSDRFLQADVSPVGQGQRITIRLDPGHPEGPISAELEASLDGKALFIPINGDMFAWIKVSPNYINFSRAVEGDLPSTTQAVILTSTDGTPFRILEVAAQATREREGAARLEFSPVPLDSAASQGNGSAAGPVSGSAATGFKIICKAFPGNGKDRTFFGTVTIRTDHPKKPLISLKYSGFFAEGPKR